MRGKKYHSITTAICTQPSSNEIEKQRCRSTYTCKMENLLFRLVTLDKNTKKDVNSRETTFDCNEEKTWLYWIELMGHQLCCR